MSEGIFICEKCNKQGIHSIWKYKELNICTSCANAMRENKQLFEVDLIKMVIKDKVKKQQVEK